MSSEYWSEGKMFGDMGQVKVDEKQMLMLELWIFRFHSD
jgi:hypothetical protein